MSLTLIFTLLSLRVKQFFRLFKGIDFIRLFFLLGLIAIVSFMLFSWSSNDKYTYPWIIIHSLIIFSIHLSRKDKPFLNSITKRSCDIYFIEYFILSLPVFIAFIINSNWKGLLVIPFIFFISFIGNSKFSIPGKIKFNMLSGLPVLNRFFRFPGTGNFFLFEWNSGLRSPNTIITGFIYLVVTCFSFTGYVAHIGMILISIFISAFYMHGEPRLFIESFSFSARRFLLNKIILDMKYITFIFLPIIIVSLVFQTEMWYLLILALIISYSIQILSVLIKYSLFQENANLERNFLILSISIIGLLLPFIWPLPVIIGIRSYKKAVRNLNSYFND
jgi:hypothetical protein